MHFNNRHVINAGQRLAPALQPTISPGLRRLASLITIFTLRFLTIDTMAAIALLLTGHTSAAAGHTEYTIEGTLPTTNQTWKVHRRFNMFAALQHSIHSSLPHLTLPSLPPKRVFGRKGAAFIEQRRGLLQVYVSALLRIAQVTQHPTFQGFFEVPEMAEDPQEEAKEREKTEGQAILASKVANLESKVAGESEAAASRVVADQEAELAAVKKALAEQERGNEELLKSNEELFKVRLLA